MKTYIQKFAESALVLLAMTVFVTSSQAAIVNAFDRGWWDDAGGHSSGNKNTFTGQDGTGTEQFNSFFSFNLAAVGGTVTGGTLKLELEAYFGPDSSEAFTVFDVGTSIATLNASGSGQLGIFNDLQSGNVYGSGIGTAAQVGSVLNITLSPQAIADINAAGGGLFAVGVHVNQISLPSGSEGLRWSGGSESRVHQLDLQTAIVPEPATVTVALLGLGALVLNRRKVRV